MAALVGGAGLGPQGPEARREGPGQGPLFANDPASLFFAILVDEDGLALGADVPTSFLHHEVVGRAVLLEDKEDRFRMATAYALSFPYVICKVPANQLVLKALLVD